MSKSNVKIVKNRATNKKFVDICKMNQIELKSFLNDKLAKYYKNVIAQDGFLYAKGKDKICLTAHMDTVHKNKIKTFVEERGENIKISSPQGIGGDDRCGIYMILEILERTNFRPTILFCEDEEIGLVGSRKFTNTKFIKDLSKMFYLIELDRKGNNDLVFYGDTNEEFHKYLEDLTGYSTAWGSCSDISNLSPACKVASVNISCGYYNQHTKDEFVILEEMEYSIGIVIKMIKDALKNKKQFEYKERVYTYSRYDGYDYYDGVWAKYLRISDNKDEDYTLWVSYMGEIDEENAIYHGSNIDAMWGKFFQEHESICMNDVLDYDYFSSKYDEYYGIKEDAI